MSWPHSKHSKAAPVSEVVAVASDTWIREAADRGSRRVGMLAAGTPFRVGATASGPGCDRWGAVERYGWACLDQSSPSALEPADLPVLADYQPPDPADFASYLDNGVWTHRPGEPLLPFVYARVWRSWKGPRYRDLASWNAGEKPIGALPSGQQARFVSAVVTPTGVVLERENGNVVPEDGVYVFPVTRFQGRDLRGEPVAEGRRPAWIVAYDGIEAEGPGGPCPFPTMLPWRSTPSR